MRATKILLSALGSGLLLGPLAGAAMGPATMKAPPAPPWRLSGQPVVSGALAADFAASGPEDRSPPTWSDDLAGAPRPSALRMAADGTRYAEPRYADWREDDAVPIEPIEARPVTIGVPAADGEVTVHRGGSIERVAAPDAGVAEQAPPEPSDGVTL